jgi:hypothetical protein
MWMMLMILILVVVWPALSQLYTLPSQLIGSCQQQSRAIETEETQQQQAPDQQ